MRYKIIDTTDDKFEGEAFEYNGEFIVGNILRYKNIFVTIEKVLFVSKSRIKLILSNYIAVLDIT